MIALRNMLRRNAMLLFLGVSISLWKDLRVKRMKRSLYELKSMFLPLKSMQNPLQYQNYCKSFRITLDITLDIS